MRRKASGCAKGSAATGAGAASLPVAVFVYSAAITRTSQVTVDAKAGAYAGSTVDVSTVDKLHRTPAERRTVTLRRAPTRVVRNGKPWYRNGSVGKHLSDIGCGTG